MCNTCTGGWLLCALRGSRDAAPPLWHRQVFEEFLGGGIILESNGAKWHRDRMLLKPAFTFQRLQVLAQTTVSRAQILCDRVAAVALPSNRSPQQEGGTDGRINMEPEFLNLTFDMACCIACVWTPCAMAAAQCCRDAATRVCRRYGTDGGAQQAPAGTVCRDLQAFNYVLTHNMVSPCGGSAVP